MTDPVDDVTRDVDGPGSIGAGFAERRSMGSGLLAGEASDKISAATDAGLSAGSVVDSSGASASLGCFGARRVGDRRRAT
jgi:hypothetical protein